MSLKEALDIVIDDKFRTPELTNARLIVFRAAWAMAEGTPITRCQTHRADAYLGDPGPPTECMVSKIGCVFVSRRLVEWEDTE